jgi:hypothetical protein
MHSFIIHPFIHHSSIHSSFIHSCFGGDHSLCSNCLPNSPRSPQSPPNLTNKATHQPNYTNSVIVSVLVFKVQKVRLIGGRKEYEHHSHPPTHPPTHSFVVLDDVMILCATTLPYKCNRPPCMIYLHVRGSSSSSSSSSRPRFTLIYILEKAWLIGFPIHR